MAGIGAKSLLLLAVCFCLFTTGATQLPSWLGQLGNLNGTLSNLLKQIYDLSANSGNTTLSDLLKQLNSTARRRMVEDISKALGTIDFASLLESRAMNGLKGASLGQCGQDLQRIMNNSLEMIASPSKICVTFFGSNGLYGVAGLLTGTHTKLQTYATYDLDAAGKPPSGIMRGNLNWGVSVEQCRGISNSHICGSSFTLFASAMQLHIPGISWSGCFPSSCTAENVSAILSVLQSQVQQLTNNRVYLIHHGSGCSPTPPGYDTGAICSLLLCAVLLLFCLIGTILDTIIQVYDTSEQNTSPSDQSNTVELQSVAPPPSEKNTLTRQATSTSAICPPEATVSMGPPRFLKSKLCEVCLCFSLVRNTKKIFSTSVPATAITSINGIRVFSIWWVILGHTFLVMIGGPIVGNKAKFVEDSKLLSIMPVINAYYAVDSFFFLSGLLVAYTCFRKLAKSDGKFNWILFYVHRFWRLTPSYMFVILFTVHLKGLISDTPLWVSTYKDPFCSDKWWTNLLYINNFYPEEFGEQCINWTWYLANDMQFFVVSPILLILAFKYGWRGLLASTGAMLLCSTIVIAAIYGAYDLDPVINLKLLRLTEEVFKKSSEYSKYVYIKPYCRIQPYLVGFILGYAIYMKYRGPIKRRVSLMALIGWSVAFAIGMALVYAPHESILPGNREWNLTENIFYGTFERLLWGLALAWVTYACHYGYGSYIQEFLSARFWIPLSRLTYSVYLMHIIVLQFMFNAVNGSIYYDLPTVSYYFIAATVLSYAVGFILAVVIEFPSENLENLALKFLQERKKYTVTS